MEDRLNRIEAKLDKLTDKQSEMTAVLAAQHVSLDEHIKRTEMLEAELKPVKKHVDRVEGAIKFFGAICVLVGAIEAIHALFK